MERASSARWSSGLYRSMSSSRNSVSSSPRRASRSRTDGVSSSTTIRARRGEELHEALGVARERHALGAQLAQDAEHRMGAHGGGEGLERILALGVRGDHAQRGAHEALSERLGQPHDQLGRLPGRERAARPGHPLEVRGRRVRQLRTRSCRRGHPGGAQLPSSGASAVAGAGAVRGRFGALPGPRRCRAPWATADRWRPLRARRQRRRVADPAPVPGSPAPSAELHRGGAVLPTPGRWRAAVPLAGRVHAVVRAAGPLPSAPSPSAARCRSRLPPVPLPAADPALTGPRAGGLSGGPLCSLACGLCLEELPEPARPSRPRPAPRRPSRAGRSPSPIRVARRCPTRGPR